MTGAPSKRCYLDHNATTPLRPQARAAIDAALALGGNASSIHREGRLARQLIEEARQAVASLIEAKSCQVTFTSGGTEANNLAIASAPVDRLILSGIEHRAVLDPALRAGKPVEILPTGSDGQVSLEALEKALAAKPGGALVSVMLANNETGVVQPLTEVISLARAGGALVHTDAVQALGKCDCSFEALGADMMTLSAHKIGGPQGAGALIVRDAVILTPQILGGGQEHGRRCGTENLAGIAGFGAACSTLEQDGDTLRNRLLQLRKQFEAEISAMTPDLEIFGAQSHRLCNTVCMAKPGLTADVALMTLDLEGIAVSSGAACSSGKVAPSHVLKAMGVPDRRASCALRISFGWTSVADDIAAFKAAWEKLVTQQAEAA